MLQGVPTVFGTPTRLFASLQATSPIEGEVGVLDSSMEFVQTIGNMYLQASDHKAIAEKKIAFFLERVRSKYFLNGESEDQFVLLLAKKSGNS